MQCLLGLVHKRAHRPLDQWQIGSPATLVLEMLQHAGRQIDAAQYVAESCGQEFALL